jgi:uncharacterized protein
MEESAWTRFWNKGGFWRALLIAAVYLALYLGASLIIGQLWGDHVDAENLFATPQSVFFGLMLPLIVGAVVLSLFLWSVGWFKLLFAKQPIGGGWWMWIAPMAIVLAIVLRFIGIDYESYGATVVIVTLISGLFVGFVEEVLTRGIAVKMLRDAGQSEWVVMALSSLIFALLHSTNILSGLPPLTVLATIGFAFGFGICMYLTLRVTGNLIWPILIHGLYDPTLFLATGGVDVAARVESSPFLAIAGPANLVFMAIAVLGLIFVRGRVNQPVSFTPPTGPIVDASQTPASRLDVRPHPPQPPASE